MTIDNWLSDSTKLLSSENGTARLDVELLLAEVLGQPRSWILAHTEQSLNQLQLNRLAAMLSRRQAHEPLAYIVGHCYFYGRQFAVDKRVLVPRPETETMIDMLLELTANHHGQPTIVDVGTGSGAVAITAALERPKATVYAIDIDPGCLAVAKHNAQLHAADIKFLRGNLLQPLLDLHASLSELIILANLPYVPDSYHINPAASHEPPQAIFGGSDGLDLYRSMFDQLQQLSCTVLTESLPPQHAALADIASNYGFALKRSQDFIQVFQRVASKQDRRTENGDWG